VVLPNCFPPFLYGVANSPYRVAKLQSPRGELRVVLGKLYRRISQDSGRENHKFGVKSLLNNQAEQAARAECMTQVYRRRNYPRTKMSRFK